MKKFFLLCVALDVGAAYGAAVGAECAMCTEYISCVVKIVSDGVPDKSILQTECTNKINSLFSTTLDATTATYWTDLGKRVGEAYVYDKNLGIFDEVSGDELKERKFIYLYEVVKYCYEYGFCGCKTDNQYLRPEGDIFDGKIGATCQECPDGGSICTGEYPIIITHCCQPAGSFSDSTGAGAYSSQCYYEGRPWD